MTAASMKEILLADGPLTGGRLIEKTGMEALPLWKNCMLDPDIRQERVGRRFMRLDRSVDGYARLSPSIRREFLTYTVIGLKSQAAGIEALARKRREEIHAISRAKHELAGETMESLTRSLDVWDGISGRVCFIIAGDIAYNMAHDVPRPEVSTGRMVSGSDLDIVAVAEDSVGESDLKALDNAILRKKIFLLTNPNYREEIDYLVKNISRVREQLEFDSFQHMIASKILYEGKFLYGSPAVFEKIKGMIEASGVPGKLARLEEQAVKNRFMAEEQLLNPDPHTVFNEALLNLFHTREEGDEIY
ncbi:MAG TPA: hypothetical protein VLL97_11185 [Acidobacteriota bacterium]|nr:hypothetical protein [Acidobacteriota bacterium]